MPLYEVTIVVTVEADSPSDVHYRISEALENLDGWSYYEDQGPTLIEEA